MGDGRDRAISESLKGIDIAKLRQGIVGQRGFDRMGMMAGPSAALGVMNPARGSPSASTSGYSYTPASSSAASSSSSSSSSSPSPSSSAEFLARPESSLSQRPARFSRELYPEEELEGHAFLDAQESRLISLTVYIVHQQLKKKVRVPACISVAEATRRIASSAHISDSQVQSLHLFLPSCSIFLAPQRKMWSYLLREDEQLELKKRSTDLVFRQATVTVQIPGTEDSTQSIEYLPQTTAAGVIRAITRKICDRVAQYGIFHGSLLLLPEDTLSARRLQDSQAQLYYRELSVGDTKRKPLILKVLLIATSGSKMVRFDSGCRIMDVLRKLVDATGSSVGCDGEMLFCLFRGNEPLDEDATLAELGLNDRDVIEFRPKPAHLVKPKSKSQPISVPVPNDEYELLATRASPSEPEKPAVAAQQPNTSTTPPAASGASPSQQRNQQQPYEQQTPKLEPLTVPTVVVEPVAPVVKPVVVAEPVAPVAKHVVATTPAPAASSNESSPIASKPVPKWSISDVGYWIEHEIGLEPIRAVFEDAEIDGRALLDLTPDELKDVLEIKVLGHRKKILNGIKALQEGAAGGASAAPPAATPVVIPQPEFAAVETPTPMPAEATGSAAEQRDSIVGAPVARAPSQGEIASPRGRGRGEQFQGAPGSPRGGLGSPRGGTRGRGRGAPRGGGVTIPRPPSGQQITRPPQQQLQQQAPGQAVARPPPQHVQQPQLVPVEELPVTEDDFEDIPLRFDLTSKLVNFLLQHNAPATEDLFSHIGNIEASIALFEALFDGLDIPPTESIFTVATVLKQYLRESFPIVPYASSSAFASAIANSDVEKLRGELSRLPAENHSCLMSLLSLCREIAKLYDATGIAFELGPLTLRRQQQGDDADMESLAIEFLVLLIENYDVFFPAEGRRKVSSAVAPQL